MILVPTDAGGDTQPRKATKPETLLAAALRRRGIVFSVNVNPDPSLRREVDVFIEPVRLAVFVDGCFWHGCPIHTRDTKSNTKWWRKKIDANRARDIRTTADLVTKGFQVLRIWEHEDPESAAARIIERVAIVTTSESPANAAPATRRLESLSVEATDAGEGRTALVAETAAS